MRGLIGAAAVLAASTGIAGAVGLDRSGQSIGILFEDGNYAELSFGYTSPSVDGVDTADVEIENVGQNFLTAGFGLKYQFNEAFSFAVIVDEPYGSDVEYPDTSTVLGGTRAVVDSYAVTGVGRYKFDENFSVHGGLRYQEIGANVTLQGSAYAGLGVGYNAAFESSGDFGFLVGGAYERPDIALRVALTYNSEITHDLDTVETIAGGPPPFPGGGIGVTEVVAPESINLDFQTGIAQDTLVFGSIRYAAYEDTIVAPDFFDAAVDMIPGNGTSLTDIENGVDLSLGLGRRFNENWAGSVAFGYSSTGDDDLVSPLAPTNGSRSIGVGLRYTVDNIVVAGGVRYTDLGDARPETGPDVVQGTFNDNSAISVGLRLGYRF